MNAVLFLAKICAMLYLLKISATLNSSLKVLLNPNHHVPTTYLCIRKPTNRISFEISRPVTIIITVFSNHKWLLAIQGTAIIAKHE